MGKIKDGEYISLTQFLIIILFSVFLSCGFIVIDRGENNKNLNRSISSHTVKKNDRNIIRLSNQRTNYDVYTRGVRNNNPLNIRYISKTKWLGEVKIKKDKYFEEFTDIHYGFRAAYIILMTYRDKYNLSTINGIINRFSPSNENNTENIVQQLEYMTGFDKDKKLNEDDYIILIQKMAIIESGYNFPLSLIKESVFIK
ncbi:structural protein P5 [Photobacterium leiognathi]|uniref:structural protein P5 n=1 Tax=Photobacterium leiognathi TaxID=553611 RepID=UPI002981E7CE|nr:structural protein P5 [Photobacterium leiognathi]